MSRKILAGTTALVMTLGMTTSATAFDRATDGGRIGSLRTGAVHSSRATHSSRYVGVRGYEAWRHGSWNHQPGYMDLGPLGVRFGDYAPGAGYGSSIAAWSR
jgi:hypothetical protein